MAGKHLKLHLEYLKVSLKTAIEYKTNFIIQVASMMLNDTVWVIFWMIFFARFQSAGGWNLNDVLMIFSVTTMAVGLTGFFFGNWRNLTKIIVQGRLDYYLTLPKNTLYHVLASRTGWYEIGDMIFGLILGLIAVPAEKWPLLLLLTVIASIIFTSFCVVVGSLAFFFQTSEDISSHIIFAKITFAMYPYSIYQGVVRLIILTILPAAFISGVPVELIRAFNLQWFLIMTGYAVLITGLAIFIFYRGLRKYESGNMLYVRD